MDQSPDILEFPYLRGPDMPVSSSSFPDPFLDMASFVLPRSLRHVLDLCEGIWLKNGTYRMALSRIARYFITNIEYDGLSSAQEDKFKDFFVNKFKVTVNLSLIGDDFLAYGNSFSSIIFPFRRYLICSKHKLMTPISQMEWEFKDWKFTAYCKACKTRHVHTHIDLRSDAVEEITVKRWAPQEIRIQQHPIMLSKNTYYWVIPPRVIAEVKRGNKFLIEFMPWELIQTIKENKIFKFAPNVMYHMREDTLAGLDLQGWGVSRLLSSFAQAWYIQILKRANETFAIDYTVPFRVLTPQAAPGRDPLQINLGDFTSRVLSMIRDHRHDPADWQVLPFPLQYQVLGAENKALVTTELISGALTELLNSLGIPAELYQGTLEFRAWPSALRLFQQTWPHLVQYFNDWLAWAANQVCAELNWDAPSKVRLQPVTLADDMERNQLLMQLASSNIVSKTTAFAPYGFDLKDEVNKIIREQKYAEEKFKEYEEDRRRRAETSQAIQSAKMMNINPQMLAAPQGQPVTPAAAVSAPGPTGEMTPEEKMQSARDMAMQLLQMPFEARKTEMTRLKHADPLMHALVKAQMENIRGEAEAQGRQMLGQQGMV